MWHNAYMTPQSNIWIEENAELKPHTTFEVGGRARYFVGVDKAEELVEAIRWAEERGIRYVIIAGGSNIVFGDGLLDMLVIKLRKPKIFGSNGEVVENVRDYIKIDGREVVCDASVALMDLINFSISKGLSGLEALSGIPGSVGGAIVGNAGAYGQTISGPLVEVEVLDGKEIKNISKEDCRFSYRDSLFKHKDWIALSARFKFDAGDEHELRSKSEGIIAKRNSKYTPGIKCPGSFFKNILIENVPPGSRQYLPKDRDYYGKVPAWFFLDQVGAKGMKQGGIEIASFHGNLLMNTGGATYNDVITLASKLKALVRDKFGIELEEEVRYIV